MSTLVFVILFLFGCGRGTIRLIFSPTCATIGKTKFTSAPHLVTSYMCVRKAEFEGFFVLLERVF